MEVAGSAVGIASFGIQVCQGLLSYYNSWQDFSDDLRAGHSVITDLVRTFTFLRASLENQHLDAERVDRVKGCLDGCIECLTQLQRKLKELRSVEHPSGKRQRVWVEVQRAAYPFRASAFEKVRNELNALQQRLAFAVQVLRLDLGTAAHDKLDAITDQLRQTELGSRNLQHSVTQLHSTFLTHQRDEKNEKIIRWLAAPDPHANHDDARGRHEPLTGSWLLESDEYKQWRALESGQLWVHGKAGCGKTVLCSTVIEDIRRYCEQVSDARLALFYFSFSDKQKQSYVGLLSSLILQLHQPGTSYERLESTYNEYKTSKPPVRLLEDILILSIQQHREVYILLDAYDELPESE